MELIHYALVLTCAISFPYLSVAEGIDNDEHRPTLTQQNEKLNVLLPETRKPFLDPHAIKPNLDESMAPTNVHTNSEYLQGQKITDTNPNQNRANQIKRERPMSPSATGEKNIIKEFISMIKKLFSIGLAIGPLSALILTAAPGGGHGGGGGGGGSHAGGSHMTGHAGGHMGGHTSGMHSTVARPSNISRSSNARASGARNRSNLGRDGHGIRHGDSHWANHHGQGWRNSHGYGWRNNRFNVGWWNGGWGLWWAGSWMPWDSWCSMYGYGWGWNNCLEYPTLGMVPPYVIPYMQQQVPFDPYDQGY